MFLAMMLAASVTASWDSDDSFDSWEEKKPRGNRQRPGQSCSCIDMFLPVCGNDGRTYANSCRSECAGVRIARKGPCSGYGGNDCAYGCSNNNSPVCGANGISYASSCHSSCFGVSRFQPKKCAPQNPRPTACGQSTSLCCGADYRTYHSPCAAQSAGVIVLHPGECLYNGLYGMYGSTGANYLSIASGSIGSSIIGLPSYIFNSQFSSDILRPFNDGQGLFTNFFNFPLQNNHAPYLPYQYSSGAYSATGSMYCLPGLQYLPPQPQPQPINFRVNDCPDPTLALQWLYPANQGCPFNPVNFGLIPGYNGIGSTAPFFNSFIPSNPLSFYQQPIAPQPAFGLAGFPAASASASASASSSASASASASVSAPTFPQFQIPQYQIPQYQAPQFQTAFNQFGQQSQLNAFASAKSSASVLPTFPSAPIAQFPSASVQPAAAAAPSFLVGSGRGLSSTTSQQSSSLAAIGAIIPSEMAAKLAKAPYVYYTYFYTIVYYKIATPETQVQGVAIKDIMFYIIENLIKVKTEQVTKSQSTVFEHSIGMKFDVSRSFDIVNDILNELQIGGSSAPGLAGPVPLSLPAPTTSFTQTTYTLGSSLSG